MVEDTIFGSTSKRPPFIDRKEELGLLKESLKDAKNGKGGMVLVEGEAGIGKSRLIEECVPIARKIGFTVLKGKCLSYRRKPYLPFIEVLREYFGITHDNFSEEEMDRLSRSINSEFPSIKQCSGEFIDLILPKQEPIGGFRIKPENIEENIELLQKNSYKIVIIGKRPSSLKDRAADKHVLEIPLDPEDSNALNPKRIEKIASKVKDIFETYKYCAVIFEGNDMVHDSNPRTKIVKMVNILTDLACANGGLIVFPTKNSEKQPYSKMNILRETDLGIKEPEIGERSDDKFGKVQFPPFEMIPNFLKDLSAIKPLLLIIEDFHWGEKHSYNLIQYLARDAGDASILIIGTYRTEEYLLNGVESGNISLRDALQRISREKLFKTLKLDRFDRNSTLELAREIYGGRIERTKEDELVNETNGNPMFIIDFVERAREEELPIFDPDELNKATSDTLISHRVSSLSHIDRRVLDLIAVNGHGISVETLQGILGINLDDLLDAIDELVDLKFLKEEEENIDIEH
jgi:predicted ATPase